MAWRKTLFVLLLVGALIIGDGDAWAQAQARSYVISRSGTVRAAQLTGTQVSALRARGETVQPNYAYHVLVTPNDPSFAQQWGLRGAYGVEAPTAWDLTTGAGVPVAVVDSGVDSTHPDLTANMWTNPDETGIDANGNNKATNGVDDDDDGYVDDVHGANFFDGNGNVQDEAGHGTHVAGIIGASGNNGIGVTGVNWRSQIMALKFLDANGSGTTYGAISAIRYGLAHGARIFNLSWGGPDYDQALYNEIRDAQAQGALFLAAAGNDGGNNDTVPVYPSSFDLPNLISVAATTTSGGLASFSNYGPVGVDLGAPGEDILSTTPNNTYSTYSGTSMATPYVSGVAALLLGLRGDAGVADLRGAVLGGVTPLSGGRGPSYLASGGLLDANNSVHRFAQVQTLHSWTWAQKLKRRSLRLRIRVLNNDVAFNSTTIYLGLPRSVVKRMRTWTTARRHAGRVTYTNGGSKTIVFGRNARLVGHNPITKKRGFFLRVSLPASAGAATQTNLSLGLPKTQKLHCLTLAQRSNNRGWYSDTSCRGQAL